ncbi:MAG: GDSL-type esterase/lipase family protein, partial [Myxococcota bacterium]|nr:GDSL-type esterase/lipase family protein [Myxococcota bacterium]
GIRTPGEATLQDRGAAHGTPLEIPEGALDRYFASLSLAEAGEPGHITRALHFGDSTIASDGITKTVRKRLQGRYGDGGPGFLAVQVDRRWAVRPGVLRDTKGAWKTLTITFGGAGMGYYGLGGTVSTARGPSRSVLGGLKVEGARQPLERFDVFFQVQPDGGTLRLSTDNGMTKSFQTAASDHGDVFHRMSAEGARTLTVETGEDGPVTLYGVALETAGPGVTWETLGVAGAGSGSHFRQGKNHIARQVDRRNPDLIVWQLGGNEVGLPVLTSGDGSKYKERYKKALKKVLAGAPSASCLVVTPLDQAERYRGQVRSKPNLTRMVRLQRDAAFELGCAFWDARAAMGGPGAFATWVSAKPALAWSDLEHLTGRGLNLIGHSLADAIEVAYADWKARNPALVGAPALAQAGQ